MKIHVSNLSRGVAEQDLRQAFGGFGQVATVELTRKQGSAVVEMPDVNQARTAIAALSGKNLRGKPIKIARPKGIGKPQGPRRHASDRRGGTRSGGGA